MKIQQVFKTFVFLLSIVVIIAGCSPSAADAGETVPSESSPAPTDAPTLEPTATTVPEPEVIELDGAITVTLLGLPDNATLDIRLAPEVRDQIPDSRYYDTLFSDLVIADVLVNGAPGKLDVGVAEICFVTEITTMNEKPVPFFWDTANDPLLDGRAQRISSSQSTPDLIICTMITASGLYGLVAR